MDSPTIVDNAAESRLETTVDGQRAELVYHRHGSRLVIVHTEVPDALAGHGIGGQLVTAAVDDAAQRGLTVVPLCPYARAWLRKHPDVANRVTIDWPED